MGGIALPPRMNGLEPVTRRMMHTWWRFSRPMTLGVRAAVIDEDERVFLVRHSYTPGWHLPGGGVEAGESMLEALYRELAEEGNIVPSGEIALHGIFFNRKVSRRDHVAIYVVRDFAAGPRPPDKEIVETGFFPVTALPEGVTPGTRARIVEIVEERPPSPDW